jgi:hypothetical protein
MKQGKSMITFVMIAMAAALAIYLGFYIFNTLNTPFSTTLVYRYVVNDGVELDGILAREEQVLSDQDGIVDVVRAEAEKVGVGQTIALAYRDSQAQADQSELDALSEQIELLEYAATQSGDVESAAHLDETILQAVVTLRASSALGDYSQLESQVMAVKSSVLKRSYTYNDDGSASADLSAHLRELKSQYNTLSKRTSSATTVIRASKSGTFSSLVDGYETILTPETVFDLTPSSLAQLMDYSGTATSSPGKLILGTRWYFAAAVPTETANRLKVGETALLRFTGDFNQDVDMLVEQLGATENDTTLVVFSSDRYLNQTTLLRCLRAELIFEDYTGLRIPKESLRMLKESVEDSSTSQTTETSRLGVYAVVSGRSEFKEVTVVIEGSDYYVVLPADTGRKILRAGDEIITRGTGIYDGQLLRS